MKTTLACLVIISFWPHRLCHAGQKVDTTFFSVRDFGALGDGKHDDAAAIVRCLNAATEHAGPVVVTIPYGIYLISRSLKTNINKCSLLVIRGVPRNGKLPVIRTDQFIDLLEVYSYYWSPKGAVSISRLSFIGNNPPYSPGHPYFDQPAFHTGIGILNLKQADILDNEIANIYGNGIGVTYSSNLFKDAKNRFDRVVIKNNRILNCWGLHPSSAPGKSRDDYGDGIYTNCIKSGLIEGNEVINNVSETKQFGRAGITLEYNDEDCRILGNRVAGYDRDLHLEQDIGGHVIRENTLYGTDFGILIYDVPLKQNKPIRIIDNIITNRGLPLNNKLTRVRNSEERCLFSFYAKDSSRQGSIIADNHFIVDAGYAYPFSSVTRFNAAGLVIRNNIFLSDMPPGKMKVVSFLAPVDTFVNNRFRNIKLKLWRGGVGQTLYGNEMVTP